MPFEVKVLVPEVIRSGDIVLTSAPTFKALAVRVGSTLEHHLRSRRKGEASCRPFARWNHALIVVDPPGLLIEAVPEDNATTVTLNGQVHAVGIDAFWVPINGSIGVYRLIDSVANGDAIARAASEKAWSHKGSPYQMPPKAFFQRFINGSDTDLEGWFCSQLIANAYLNVSCSLFPEQDARVTPDDIANSSLLRLISEAVTIQTMDHRSANSVGKLQQLEITAFRAAYENSDVREQLDRLGEVLREQSELVPRLRKQKIVS